MQGKKFDTGKPMLSLVPKELVEGAARAFEFGMHKYGRNNFKKGMAWSRIYDALLRHTFAVLNGEENDPESKLPHVDHMAACIGMLQYYVKNNVGVNDLAIEKSPSTKSE